MAEQEVQAAINAERRLPTDLPAPPLYAKINPADAPVMTLAVTSDTLPLTDVENLVDTRLGQKISQIPGVGLVSLSGGARPAVRIQIDTQQLAPMASVWISCVPSSAIERQHGEGQLRWTDARLQHQCQRSADDGG